MDFTVNRSEVIVRFMRITTSGRVPVAAMDAILSTAGLVYKFDDEGAWGVYAFDAHGPNICSICHCAWVPDDSNAAGGYGAIDVKYDPAELEEAGIMELAFRHRILDAVQSVLDGM